MVVTIIGLLSLLCLQFALVPSVSAQETPSIGTITVSPDPMTPQYEWTTITVPVTVTDPDHLSDVYVIQVTVFYDSAGDDPAAPSTANVQTCAILTWTRFGIPWAIDPGTGTAWDINEAGCTKGDDESFSGNWVFSFKVGSVATESTGSGNWDIYAKATDHAAVTGNGELRDIGMNWYGEVTVNTGAVDWGSVALGSDFAANEQTGISVTYIANGAYDENVAAESSWTGASGNATLDVTGTCTNANEFSLKADDTATLASAVLVTASPAYVTLDDTGVQTTEAGDIETTNTLWLKVASTFAADTYSGTIYYQIAP